ncbi:MAG: hypothetical protein JWO91_342 [Acidobacteriaceae bacterium]|nr:hypothetical protein [Acidobacteriaceae bacterium]
MRERDNPRMAGGVKFILIPRIWALRTAWGRESAEVGWKNDSKLVRTASEKLNPLWRV